MSLYLGDIDLTLGVKGENGKSAYEYAVEAGYQGSEEEFAEQLANGALISDIPTKVSELTNDSGYLTEHPEISFGSNSFGNIIADYGSSIQAVSSITLDDNGHVTSFRGNTVRLNPTVDSALSDTSTYPVQNKVVTAALNEKANVSDVMSTYNKTTIWNADETVYTTTWTVDGVEHQEVFTEVSETQYTRQYYVGGVLNGTWTMNIDESNRTSTTTYVTG